MPNGHADHSPQADLVRVYKKDRARTAIRTFPIERDTILPDPLFMSIFAATNLDWCIGITITALEVVTKLSILN